MYTEEALFPVRKNDRFGYVNRIGKVVVEIKYDHATEFGYGHGCLRQGNVLTIVDVYGNSKASISGVDDCRPCVNGYLVVTRQFKYGVFDVAGSMVIESKYDLIYSEIYEQVTVALLGKRVGLLDMNGTWSANPKWDSITVWHEGSSVAMAYLRSTGVGKLINRAGEYVSDREFVWGGQEACGVFPVEFSTTDGAGFGLVDALGNIVLAGNYDDMGSYATNNSIAVELNGKWGVIDLTGNWLVEPRFEKIEVESCGLRVFKDNESGLYGYMTSKGEVAIEPQFSIALPFMHDLAHVHKGGRGRAGFMQLIDKCGNVIFESRG